MIAAIALAAAPLCAPAHCAAPGKIVIVMVWDGLRPDAVTIRDTPNLYSMAREGVRFDRHHSEYPTLTMVNAAALATGAPPAETGILGNTMYLLPALKEKGGALDSSPLAQAVAKPLLLENTKWLGELNSGTAFAGRLVGLDTVAQELEREGGYLAVIGKKGPAFLWDNRVETVKDGRDALLEPHKDYFFATDDYAAPAVLAGGIKVPAANREGVIDSARDAYFTGLLTERALPSAKLASDAGRPSLIVLWQHNPDLTQHDDGLGTLPALEALSTCDVNLAKIRAAIVSSTLADRTDLMVVSDHGFATIRMTVDLNALLANAGLKKSLDSDDVVIARDGGSDLLYLSRTSFPTAEARRLELRKIVDFAEAQEWCGPIFSREAAIGESDGKRAKPYLGWIDGTFAQPAIGLFNSARSPDLVISFREVSDRDNQGLTGPEAPAFALVAKGETSERNRSKTLVHPVRGLVYADAQSFTAGMGMHGAAGQFELHAFCAAFGPDFRRAFVDRDPTANVDVAPTITHLLGLLPNIGSGGLHPTGREMSEALRGERSFVGTPRPFTMTTKLTLQGVDVTTTLKLTRLGDRQYLDDSNVVRNPLGSSP